MKTIQESELEQGSSAWLEWRMQGIGASEVAIVMGISPYKTAYELWENKIGLRVENNSSNFIFEKGHRLEPKIRAMYEIQTGNDATPCLVMREDNPKHRASLDGRDAEKKICVEMKYVGAGEKWALAQEGKAPDFYFSQMQWQMYVTGDLFCDYVVYNDKEDKIIIIRIDQDIPYIKDMVKQVNAFLKLVETKKEPPLTAKDWKDVKSVELKEKVAKYTELKTRFDQDKKDLEALSKEITTHEKINHPRINCYGLKITEITRKGSVDFKKIVAEKLPEFDTSGYVKASTTYRSIKL